MESLEVFEPGMPDRRVGTWYKISWGRDPVAVGTEAKVWVDGPEEEWATGACGRGAIQGFAALSSGNSDNGGRFVGVRKGFWFCSGAWEEPEDNRAGRASDAWRGARGRDPE